MVRRGRRSVVVAAVVTAVLGTVAAQPAVAAPAVADVAVSSVLGQLVVQPESSTPAYDRAQFPHWVDADGDGCDTRAEVLAAESLVPVTYRSGCTVDTGRWVSWYDGATWTLASDVDIDHMVPLQEAWQSGAAAWTVDQRRAFANDLDLGASLEAVTDDVNQSKGARDPAQWLPPAPDAACTYAAHWTLVKYRWRLAVDAAERDALTSVLVDGCGDPAVPLPVRADVPDPTTGTDPLVVPVAPFPDVPTTHPFVQDIAWLASSGLTTGYADGRFHPAAGVSRQAFAAYLYRYTHGGADAPACSRAWFWDAPASDPFCGEIWWLASTGITTGYADNGFHPTAPISRQAMAAFLQRYREAAAPTGSSCDRGLFSDMGATSFCGAVTWLASTDITTGYTDGTFRPTAPVTRQAVAAYLHRYDARFVPSSPPVVVSPPPVVLPPPAPPVPQPPAPQPPAPQPPAPPANPGDSVNCSSFANWGQAQAWFDRYHPYYGDVARLDGDGDLIACESLPGAP